MENVQLRQFQDGDTEALYSLHIRGLQQSKGFIDDPEGRKVFDKDFLDLRAHYLDNRGEFLVAESDGRIVGMGALQKVNDSTGEIKRMRIEPEFQGKGLGKTILERLMVRAKELGYKKLILDTSTNQIPAQRLYESYGFKEYKRAPLYDLEMIYYEKEI